jgi:recombination protein RecR
MPPELLAAIEAIQSLPGIGRRSAMRIAFDFVRQGKSYTDNFTQVMQQLAERVAGCERCGAYISLGGPCPYCDNPRRNQDSLCVVEYPSDIYAVENTGEFHGYYHVLGGVLSPLDGVGPNELRLPQLAERVKSLNIKEVIVATNPSVEGNATGHYIADALKPSGVRVTRIATGLALGQMLDYADTQAITQSLKQRVEL